MDPPGGMPLLGAYPATSGWTNERQRDRDRNTRLERNEWGMGAGSSYMYSPYQPGSSMYDGYGGGRDRQGGMNYSGDYYDEEGDGRSRSRERIPSWNPDWSLRGSRREEKPNRTIVVRGLSPDINEVHLLKEVTRYGLQPRDVRLHRRKETGVPSGYAFVEFASLQDSIRWKQQTQGVLLFQGGKKQAWLTFSDPKGVITLSQNSAKKQPMLPTLARFEGLSRAPNALKNVAMLDPKAAGDWFCSTCGVNNFRKRELCFKCNFPREGVSPNSSEGATLAKDVHSSGPEASKQGDGPPKPPGLQSTSLLFRNLDLKTTEEGILEVLGGLTTIPIKSLNVAKDTNTNISKGFCTVELNTPAEATELHSLLQGMGEKFIINESPVTVSYARRPRSTMNRLVCKLYNRKERMEGKMKDRSKKSEKQSRSRDEKGDSSSQSPKEESSSSDRDAADGSDQESGETPNRTIVVRGLAPSVSKSDLHKQVLRHGLKPTDIRLLRKKGTGASRGFAFVEFQSESESAKWKELTEGILLFEGENRATLHYSAPLEVVIQDRAHASRQNWLCNTCSVSNFRQRTVCFQCNTPRVR